MLGAKRTKGHVGLRLGTPSLQGGVVLLVSLLAAVLVACSDAAEAFPSEAPPDVTDTDSGPGNAAVPAEDADVIDDPGKSDAGADGGLKDTNLGNSSGCGKAAAATGLANRTISIAGTKRTYVRFIPPSYDPSKPVALVIALHGSGGTGEKARSSYGLEAEAKGQAIFLYPDGLPYDPAFPGENRWNPTKGSDDYAFFDALQTEVEASHCVDRDRVFMVGFSNGARMTSMVGCYRGDTIRAIAVAAPGGTASTLPLQGCVGEVGVWGGIGADDAEHVPGATIVRTYYTGANGCATSSVPITPNGCVAFNGCRPEVPVVNCGYPGGHAWPSIGAQSVWDFFTRFK